MKVRSGDKVVVIAGKDKGTEGKIIKAMPKENRVIVEGVNVATMHKKPKSQQDKGGIIKVEKSIDASNVMLVCEACKKPTRVAMKLENGTKTRTCKQCGKPTDKNAVIKAPKGDKAKTAKVEKKTTKKEKIIV